MKSLHILICNYMLKYAQLFKSNSFVACALGLKIEFRKIGIFWVNFHKNVDSEKLQSSIFSKNYRKTLE